ncbi:MAG TPA: prepilin-type N-terminal cleavage/methylation domain-containing protein [Labilithrix sp.]|nr:prepilin-type N-terminal cleavage/methylation domain-containing protein [Labilithrix sp.]
MKTHARRSNQRGYTAVEVLSALTLLAIGASGVIGMQRVTLQGSEDARRFDIGGNIANEWCSRLQRDSAQWTEPNAVVLNNNNITATKFLKSVATCSAAFCNPPAALPAAGMSGSFDTFGIDLPAAATTATYCAQYRLQWIADPGAAAPYNPAALMRAEVRVFWSRLDQNPVGDCAAATPDAANAYKLYHFVYATTMVRESAFRQ